MEQRLYVTRREVRRPRGGSYAIIECPFCGCETEARLWSLAGSGKRCSGCGAVHSGRPGTPVAVTRSSR